LHYSNTSVMLSVHYRCIIVHYRKLLWGVFQYVVLSVLQEVLVGHIASSKLHVTEYVFPDEYGHWTVIWSLLCITNVLAAFIGKYDTNIVKAAFWEWASTEHQWFWALNYGQFMFRLVADIHWWDIGSLWGQKQQRHAPCRILKMSVNGASTVLGLAYFVIEAMHRSSHT